MSNSEGRKEGQPVPPPSQNDPRVILRAVEKAQESPREEPAAVPSPPAQPPVEGQNSDAADPLITDAMRELDRRLKILKKRSQ